MTTVRPFLWLGERADEAARFYHQVFSGSRDVDSMAMGEPGESPGGFTSVTLSLPGCEVVLFNGGPFQQLNQAFSLFVECDDQAEVDRLWDHLISGGVESQCGWLTDRFGVTWQIVPKILGELLSDPDPERAGRVHAAMMKMVKLDSAVLQAAYDNA